MTVALVTAAAARHLDEDLPPLCAALGRAGIAHEVVVWDDPSVPWTDFELAVLRSTWDYPARRDEFVAWARRVPTRLLNAPEIVAWNTDKRYLRDLALRGVPVVSTAWIGPTDPIELPEVGDFVVKPAIGAGAIDSARYGQHRLAQAAAHVGRLQHQGRTAMVQPYLFGVDTQGETALVFFRGAFSHGVRKGPIFAAETRYVEGLYAKEEIGPRAASPQELALARRALDAVPGGPEPLLYARVDVAPDSDGSPLLLELELTEPSVFLCCAENAADRMAAAIASSIGR